MVSGDAAPFAVNDEGACARVSCTCKLRRMGFAYATARRQAATKARENMAAATEGLGSPKGRVSDTTEGELVGGGPSRPRCGLYRPCTGGGARGVASAT